MQQPKMLKNMIDPGEKYLSMLSSAEATISIVVPVMNEQGNVRALYEKVSAKLNQLGKRYEIIFIDDGSKDGTFFELQKLYQEHPNTVEVIRFRRNFGKTPALVAGFSRSRGDVVFTMDGDLQDDPEEIPQFLAKLDEGYDLVTGWKFPRLDPITKTFPSRIFNGLVSKFSGVPLHDINCGFKAYRREVMEDVHLKLYGEFHRFIPVMAHWRGFRVAEIKVRHHPRTSGVSKFGGRRFARGLIDLLTVLFLTSSLHTPLRLFGKLGFWTFVFGALVDGFVVTRSFTNGEPIHNQPLLFVGILLLIFGFLFVLIGLLGEMIRYYAFESGEEYSIKQELTKQMSRPTQQPVVPVGLSAPAPVVPAAPAVPLEVYSQQEIQQSETQPWYEQLSTSWDQQPSLAEWQKDQTDKHLARRGHIPRRPGASRLQRTDS